MHYMNGHRGPVPPPDHTSILLTIVTMLVRIDQRLQQPESGIPKWEVAIKAGAPYVILPLVAWATGSWQAATDVVRLLVVK